jgi:amino acid transporter
VALLTSHVHPWADALRVCFLTLAGLYFGVAVATLRRYMRNPPRSRLRKFHVWGVSMGVTVLIAGYCGLVVELLGQPLQWYGAPVAATGVALIIASLFVLYRDQSAYIKLGRNQEIPERERRAPGRRHRDKHHPSE